MQALGRYGESELAEVVDRVSRRMGVPATAEAALEVARRSRGTPRSAVSLLEWARDVAQVRSLDASSELESPASVAPDLRIHVADVVCAAKLRGIDAHGLDIAEQTVVRFLLRQGNPVGLEALASRLGLDLETLREIHEPILEREGLVERTERGRVATDKARLWCGEAARVVGGSSSGRDGGSRHGGRPALRDPPYG